MAWRHDEAVHEADGLRAWAGDGVVLLHDHAADESTSVLLLERCRPGTPLSKALPEPQQDHVVAGLLHRLWRAPTRGYPFRPLRVMCDAWAAEFHQRLADVPGLIDPGLARAAALDPRRWTGQQWDHARAAAPGTRLPQRRAGSSSRTPSA